MYLRTFIPEKACIDWAGVRIVALRPELNKGFLCGYMAQFFHAETIYREAQLLVPSLNKERKGQWPGSKVTPQKAAGHHDWLAMERRKCQISLG